MTFKWYFGHQQLLCWYFGPIVMIGNHLGTKQIYVMPRQTDVVTITSQPHLSRQWGRTFEPLPHHIQTSLLYWGYDFTSVTRRPRLRSSCCNVFDLQASVTAHSLNAISPSPSRRGGNYRCQATPCSYGAGHFCKAQTLVMMFPIQMLVPYIYKTRTL